MPTPPANPTPLHPALVAAGGFAQPLITDADLEPAWDYVALDLRLAMAQEFLLEQHPELTGNIDLANAAAAALTLRKPGKRWAIFSRWLVRRLRDSDLKLALDAGADQFGWWPNVEERSDGLAVVRFLPDRAQTTNVPLVLELDDAGEWKVLYIGLYRPVPTWPPTTEPLKPTAPQGAG